MSIIFWTISCASLGLAAVAVIANRLSCCAVTFTASLSPAARTATSLSFDTVFTRSVPRTTFWRLTDEASVCRMRSTSRSEEHTSELQSLMRNSYPVFCLTKETLSTPDTSDQHACRLTLQNINQTYYNIH